MFEFIYWLLSYVVPFLAVLTVIVFVHEMGHYLVARWNGIAIQTFSIGFGRELIGWNDKQGTRWRISAIPLGGYVRFVGDMDPASTPDREAIEKADPELAPRLFANKNVWQRIAVVLAGPVANVILTFLILYALLLGYGRYTIPPVVGAVIADSPAQAAGLEPGDIIVSVDGYAVRGFEDFQRLVATSPERAGEILAVIIGIAEMRQRQQAAPRRGPVQSRCRGHLGDGLARSLGGEGLDGQQALGEAAHDVALGSGHGRSSLCDMSTNAQYRTD